jgi:hypothetical protein
LNAPAYQSQLERLQEPFFVLFEPENARAVVNDARIHISLVTHLHFYANFELRGRANVPLFVAIGTIIHGSDKSGINSRMHRQARQISTAASAPPATADSGTVILMCWDGDISIVIERFGNFFHAFYTAIGEYGFAVQHPAGMVLRSIKNFSKRRDEADGPSIVLVRISVHDLLEANVRTRGKVPQPQSIQCHHNIAWVI